MTSAINIAGYNLTAPGSTPTVTAYVGPLVGNLNIGAVYQYVYTFLTAFGESTPSAVGSATTTGTAAMSLVIPVSTNTNVYQRNIYRTTGGGSTLFNLNIITDNLTTAYLDSTADINLGGLNPPTYNNANSISNFSGRLQLSPFPTQYSITTAITAHAGGGQTLAVPLTTEYNFISVCATLNNSVLLPNITANYVGMRVCITNNGAQTAAVFPAVGQDAGAGTNTAVSLTATSTGEWIAVSSTLWARVR